MTDGEAMPKNEIVEYFQEGHSVLIDSILH